MMLQFPFQLPFQFPSLVSFKASNLIYAAMILLVFWGFIKCLLRMLVVRSQLKRARIRLTEEKGRKLAEDILSYNEYTADPAKDLFSDKALRYQFGLYQQDIRHTAGGSRESYICDIGDYFNYDLLDQICRSGFNDHIPGALTALGILGTFLGLIIGLKDFDTSTSEKLLDGVSQLLIGMRFAFWTSIVGISFSLLYGFVARSIKSSTEYELDLFLDEFRNNVLQSNKESALNQVRKSLDSLQDSGKEISEAVTAPMKEMKESLDKFCEYATREQTKAMEVMTKTFVKALNEALEDNMKNLAESLETARNYNQAYNQSFAAVIDRMQSMIDEINGINSTLNSTIVEYQKVNAGVQAINDSVEKKLQTMDENIKKDLEALKIMNTTSKQLRDCARELSNVSMQVESQRISSEKALDEIKDCGKEMVKVNQQAMEEQLRTMMLSSSDFADYLTNTSTEYAQTAGKVLDQVQDHLRTEIQSLVEDNNRKNKERAKSVNNLEALTKETGNSMNQKLDQMIGEMHTQNARMNEMIDLLRKANGMPRKTRFFDRFKRSEKSE